MPAVPIIEGSFVEGEDIYLVARPTTADGQSLVHSAGTPTVTDWEIYLYDKDSSTPNVAIYSLTAQAPGTAFFSSLQTDGFWDGLDEKGYSFRISIPAGGFTAIGGHVYRAEVKVNTISFAMVPLRFLLTCEAMTS